MNTKKSHPQTKQGGDNERDLFAVLIVVVGIIILLVDIAPFISATVLLAVFVGLAYMGFIIVLVTHLRNQEEDQVTVNMRRVVSLGRQCPETTADDVIKCLTEQVDARKLFVYAALPAAR
jgi:hypothetical protein